MAGRRALETNGRAAFLRSFPRKRESRGGCNNVQTDWVPAFAATSGVKAQPYARPTRACIHKLESGFGGKADLIMTRRDFRF
jgi:hypothetical protein